MTAAPYDPLYLEGVSEFNRSNYFESHEVWEALWRAEAGPSRAFYKGLIQAAVALHHWRRGNRHGATKLLARSQRLLKAYPKSYLGLDVETFLADVSRCIAPPDAGRVATKSASLPEIHLQPSD